MVWEMRIPVFSPVYLFYLYQPCYTFQSQKSYHGAKAKIVECCLPHGVHVPHGEFGPALETV